LSADNQIKRYKASGAAADMSCPLLTARRAAPATSGIGIVAAPDGARAWQRICVHNAGGRKAAARSGWSAIPIDRVRLEAPVYHR